MRRLAETEVLKSAAIGSVVSCLACYPRLMLWQGRVYPIWFLTASLLATGFVLWAFVFAWHTKYSGRPVFNFRPGAVPWIAATVAGVVMATVLYFLFDPVLRQRAPEEYPANFPQWVAMSLFSIGFGQLVLIYAPFAWSLRLMKMRRAAIFFTAAFVIFMVLLKIQSSQKPMPPGVLTTYLFARAAGALAFVWFYSRYGIVLATWWGFLMEARHLFDL